MAKAVLFLFVSFALIASADSIKLNDKDYPVAITGKVIEVNDGDTIRIESGKQEYSIRLLGIDAPESKGDFGVDQEYGPESSAWLKKRLTAKTVKILPSKKCVAEKKLICYDQYGRVLGTVIVDGVDINLESVKAGMSHYFKYYESDNYPEMAVAYAAAESRAKESKIGLWSLPDPMDPYQFRKIHRSSSAPASTILPDVKSGK